MVFPAAMCASAQIVARFSRRELDLGFLAFLYVLRSDVHFVDLKTMGDIDATQHQDNGLAPL